MYHHTYIPSLSTPFRRKRKEFWIRKLGTAFLNGYNDNVESVGNLSNPHCNNVNVLRPLNNT